MPNVDLNNLERREPEVFAAGDTLLFQRYWPEYPASQGWYLQGVLTDLNGNVVPAGAYQSVAQEDAQMVNVQNWCQAVAEGDYILAEYIVIAAGNAAGINPERHQVYRAVLTITSDLADGLASVPQITFAQQMVTQLQQTLLTLAGRLNGETDMERTHFVLQKIEVIEQRLFRFQAIVANEKQVARAKNGQPAGNEILPVFCVG